MGQDVKALADAAKQKFGAVHVLCNNAGVGMGGALWEHTLRDWEWLFGVNVWGVVHGIKAFVPMMLTQGDECHIVNTASAAGLDARPWLGMYSASKYAVVAISESLREELKMTGAKIGVSVGLPGGRQHPNRRCGAKPAGSTPERCRCRAAGTGASVWRSISRHARAGIASGAHRRRRD